MRRSYISPEFVYKDVFGTFNMKEESSFFGSKMLEIEDKVELTDQSLVYYQNEKGEQLDISTESLNAPIVYSVPEDLKNLHTLTIDESQNDFQRNTKTRYILSINLSKILENFIFATLKQYRTFEGVKIEMCYSNDVNFSMRQYIIKNVIDRYKFVKPELYISYQDLRGQDIRRFDNKWATNSQLVSIEQNKFKNFQTETEYDFSATKITFSQEKSSQLYNFEYYYKLFWEKM